MKDSSLGNTKKSGKKMCSERKRIETRKKSRLRISGQEKTELWICINPEK